MAIFSCIFSLVRKDIRLIKWMSFGIVITTSFFSIIKVDTPLIIFEEDMNAIALTSCNLNFTTST